MTTPTTPVSQPWKTAFLAGMASYLDAGAIVSTGIALVLFAPTLGISAEAMGLLSGLLTLCFALGAVFGGRLGDRFGRRRVYGFTLALYAVGVLLLALASGTAMLYVGVVLVGLAIGADLPVSLALIAEEAPEGKKGKMIIFSGILWSVGIFVPAVLAIFVASMGEMGGRILYGQLFVVAVIVLIARLGLRESAEWSAARAVKDAAAVEAARESEIRISAVPQLFVPPILFTVLATALYYAIWNLGANTFGQFGTFIWVNLAGGTVELASMVSLALIPLGIVGAIIFMRVVDKPARKPWFVAGTVINMIAFAIPLVFGPTIPALLATNIGFGIGVGFAGESIYKVWSQELFPTLLRSTAQGVTLAFARVVAGLFAFITPGLAVSNSPVLFGLLFAFAVIAGLIGLFWIPKLPTARELEPVPAEAATAD